jgi:Tfp pilus assembly protein PilX
MQRTKRRIEKTAAIRFALMTTVMIVVLVAISAASSMQDPAAKEQLQAKIADIKASLAANAAALRQYTWQETTEMSLKGDVKSKTQNACSYGADGKVQKKLVSAPPEKKEKPKGLKGKVVENKVEDIKDYMESTGKLIKLYVPPDPAKMQASMAAGKGALTQPSAGKAILTFSDYALPGDKFSITFDTAGKKIVSVNVNTYLDKPDDKVSLDVAFTSLPEGPNYLSSSLLDVTAKKIQVKTTNAGYKLAAK